MRDGRSTTNVLNASRNADGRHLQSLPVTLGGIAASAALDSRAAVLPLAYRLFHPISVTGLLGVGQTCRFDVTSVGERLKPLGAHIHHRSVREIMQPLAVLSYWVGEPLARQVFEKYPVTTDAVKLREKIAPVWGIIQSAPADIWADENRVLEFARSHKTGKLEAAE